jgi:Big-like domain-containing protein
MKSVCCSLKRRIGAAGVVFALLFRSPHLASAVANSGSELTVTSPIDGQAVQGNAVNIAVAAGPDVASVKLQVDGTMVVQGTNNLVWNSTTVPNGSHTLTVQAFQRGGSIPIGEISIPVLVKNPALASSLGAVPQHFQTLPSGSTLHTGAQCAAMIPATPETVAANSAFNRTTASASQLAAYAAGGYTVDSRDDYRQYKRAAGQYTGSTDMIMRWAACKYGIDEDVVRAQAWVESKWLQGGAGDERTSQSQCVQGNFSALWDTAINDPDGTSVACPGCCFRSWSAWQTKVFYEWMTWPQIMESTSFAADYRYADQRACMDGAYTSYYSSGYYSSGAQQPNSYSADVAKG